ncbi:MAG TPA: sigma-70 family RNA polymerase sigma factor [Candidatus Polarisedimenticolia bacterium]|nr:sigma-70 family RNA polymerase sigma factor [Candidatus Polarisedimenticolia bacterium]
MSRTGSELDLGELLARCRRGDDLAWEALVRRFQARVYGLAFHYVRHAEEARDLAQEIFVRVYRKLDTFREEETFLPWMLRLGRNVCIDHLRRAKARPPATDLTIGEDMFLADTAPTPEAAWMADSRKRLVHRALQMLSEPYREMILLKEIQGLPLEEIASMLNLPLGTVKSRSSRARVELAHAVLALDAGGSEGRGAGSS